MTAAAYIALGIPIICMLTITLVCIHDAAKERINQYQGFFYTYASAHTIPLVLIYGLFPGWIFGHILDGGSAVTIATSFGGMVIVDIFVTLLGRLFVKMRFPQAKFRVLSMKINYLGRGQ